MRRVGRILTLTVALLLALTLCACVGGGASTTYTVEKNGTVYTVDQAAGTIDDGEYTYHFVINPYGDGY